MPSALSTWARDVQKSIRNQSEIGVSRQDWVEITEMMLGKVRRLWELPQRWDLAVAAGTRFQRVFPSCKPQQWRPGQWDFGPGTEVPKHKSNAYQPEGAATQATQVAVSEQDSRTDEDRRIANVWGFPEIGVPPNHPFIDGFSITNHPFGGTPIYRNHHLNYYIYHWQGAQDISKIGGL